MGRSRAAATWSRSFRACGQDGETGLAAAHLPGAAADRIGRPCSAPTRSRDSNRAGQSDLAVSAFHACAADRHRRAADRRQVRGAPGVL